MPAPIKYTCEWCGKETDSFGDVGGAIACEHCMVNDPDCQAAVAEFELEVEEQLKREGV